MATVMCGPAGYPPRQIIRTMYYYPDPILLGFNVRCPWRTDFRFIRTALDTLLFANTESLIISQDSEMQIPDLWESDFLPHYRKVRYLRIDDERGLIHLGEASAEENERGVEFFPQLSHLELRLMDLSKPSDELYDGTLTRHDALLSMLKKRRVLGSPVECLRLSECTLPHFGDRDLQEVVERVDEEEDDDEPDWEELDVQGLT